MKKTITFLSLFLTIHCFSQDINFGLKLYYPMNGNVEDYSGNNFDGDPYGVTYTEDRFGNPNGACHFNGIDNYVNFPDDNELKADFPISFSFWVKYDDLSYQKQTVFNTSFEENRSTGVWFNSTSSTGRYAVNFGDGNYFYTPDSRRTYVSNSVIETTLWHHVAVIVLSGTQMLIFVDGEETGGDYSGDGGDLMYSLTPGCLGRHDRDLSLPADYLEGSIDDFAYWGGKALNEEEVYALRNNTAVLSTNTVSDSSTFSIYPNPVDDKIFIVSENTNVQVSLFNSLGQQVYSGINKPSIDVSQFASGVYYLKTTGENPQTKKVIIK